MQYDMRIPTVQLICTEQFTLHESILNHGLIFLIQHGNWTYSQESIQWSIFHELCDDHDGVTLGDDSF